MFIKLIQLVLIGASVVQIQAMSLQQMFKSNVNSVVLQLPLAAPTDVKQQTTVSTDDDFAERLSDYLRRRSTDDEAFFVARQTDTGSSGGTGVWSTILTSILTTAIIPALGPLATVAGPLITNAFSGLFGGIFSRHELPGSGYEAFTVTGPNEGSFILLAKLPSTTVADDTPPLPQLNQHLNGIGLDGLLRAVQNQPHNGVLVNLLNGSGVAANGGQSPQQQRQAGFHNLLSQIGANQMNTNMKKQLNDLSYKTIL